MIPHFRERAAALEALGWTGPDAEWLALVCLHSGVFLRRSTSPSSGAGTASRRRGSSSTTARGAGGRQAGRRAPVERPWRGSTRLCMVAPRALYRALGAEHVRHRREASPAVVLRRLLSSTTCSNARRRGWRPRPPRRRRRRRRPAAASCQHPRRAPPLPKTPALLLDPVSSQWCKSVRNGSTRPIPCPTLAGMAMGTTRDDGSPQSMWVATADQPQGGGRPIR